MLGKPPRKVKIVIKGAQCYRRWIFIQHLTRIAHLDINKISSGDTMRFRKREPLFSVLLDTSLRLLDSLRSRFPDNMDHIKGKVRDTYSIASDRVSRATDALRGEEESHIFGKAVALAIGVGIGIGIGALIAPASGKEMRADIADRVSDFGDTVNEPSGKKPPSATGTHG
jgi:hypothetical protein